MRCIACGREMLDRGTHYECSNILCDYEEAKEHREVWVRAKRGVPTRVVNDSVKIFSLFS